MELDRGCKTGWYYDLESIISSIRGRGIGRGKVVGLQFPEGLKHLFYISKEIEDLTGARVIVSGKPCYGACDIDERLGSCVDILFHFGHAEIGNDCVRADKIKEDGIKDGKINEDKTVFVQVRSKVDVKPVVKKALEMLNGDKIGVVTTVQHIHMMDDVKKVIEGDGGKKAIIRKGDSRIKYNGQILGCNFSSARIDCDELLFVGSGNFHPIGASIATGKRVVIADPLMNEVRVADPEKIIRQRYAVIGKALDSNSFGILIGSKEGQKRLALAEEIYEKAKRAQKEAYMIMLDEFDPDLLMPFKVDCFVNTACPRIAIDDIARFKKPMLTPVEFEIAIGERKWEDFLFDEILG